jgi:hypothetical protein
LPFAAAIAAAIEDTMKNYRKRKDGRK